MKTEAEKAYAKGFVAGFNRATSDLAGVISAVAAPLPTGPGTAAELLSNLAKAIDRLPVPLP